MDIAILVGLLIGLVIGCIFVRVLPWEYSGTLEIDRSDENKDTYRLVVKDLDKMSKSSRVVFKVNNHADLSQQ